METKELENTIGSLEKEEKKMKKEWELQTNVSYRLTHKPNGKKNNLLLILFIYGCIAAFVIAALTGTISNTVYGSQLQSDHIYSSPNGNWAGYPYQMIQHSDTYGTRFYSPVDGVYIGWMDANHAAVNETR
jgi:hypothetical protein